MNRRSFLKSTTATAAVLATPPVTGIFADGRVWNLVKGRLGTYSGIVLISDVFEPQEFRFSKIQNPDQWLSPEPLWLTQSHMDYEPCRQMVRDGLAAVVGRVPA